MSILGDKRFKNGYKFPEVLRLNLGDYRDRVLVKNKACIILIDGGVGEGKTTFAVECADYINGGPISFHKQYAMGGTQFIDKLRVSYKEKLCVVVYDEAGDFTSRGALTKFNALLNRVFEVYRAFKIVVILVLPTFASIDKQIFDKGLVRVILHCYGRQKNYGRFKAYGVAREIGLLLERTHAKKDIHWAYRSVIPNFWGEFLDLDKDRAEELYKISVAGKLDILEKATIKTDGLLSIQDVADQVGMSYVWTQRRIKELGVKERRVLKNKKYFGKEVLKRVMSG